MKVIQPSQRPESKRSGLRPPFAIAVVLLLSLVGVGAVVSATTVTLKLGTVSTIGADSGVAAGATAGTLLAGKSVGSVPPDFWSLAAQTTTSTGIASNPLIGKFVNSSPFIWLRYGQGGDQCNITTNQLHGDNGLVSGGCAFNIASLKQWCSSRPSCHTVLDLPGENNNSAEDAAIAKWIVHTVGFQPDYWSIGNEPMLWKHYGLPWTSWATTDHRAPTSLAYAYDVKAAIAAVKKVDTGARFIGIEADCECSPTWFKDVVHVNGPNLAAIAYHTYPSTALKTTETLTEFYAPLSSTTNITTSYATVRADIRGQCPSCATLPIFVGEYNGGPGWAASNWGGTYANAVFLAASTIQALEAGVPMFTIFNLQTYGSGYGFSMVNGSSTVGPTGLLYSTLLSHLVGGTIHTVPIKTSLAHVWAVLEVNGLHESLLVVNADLTHNLSLSVGGVLGARLHDTSYLWQPGKGRPATATGLLGATVQVPSQGILLLKVDLPAPKSLAALAAACPAVAVSSLAQGGNVNLSPCLEEFTTAMAPASPPPASGIGALGLRLASDSRP
jgi:hypothetical protein